MYEYFNFYSANPWSVHRPDFKWPVGHDVLQKCSEHMTHMFGQDGRLKYEKSEVMEPFSTSPIVIRTKQDIYIHVYGKLRYFILDLIDQENLGGLLNQDLRRQHLSFQGVVGSKIVYKRPPSYAAEGCRFMVKVYVGGPTPPSANVLREKLSHLFKKKVYNSALSTYSEWLISRECSTIGQLEVKGQVKDNGRFKYVEAHHSEVQFNTGMNFKPPDEEFQSLMWQFLKQKVFPLITDVPILNLCLGHKLRKDSWDFTLNTNLTLKKLKRSLLIYFVGELKNLTNKNSLDSHFNRYEHETLDLHGAQDKVTLFAREVLRFQYLLRLEIKQFWLNVIVKKYLTPQLEKQRLDIITSISGSLPVLCYDIETSFEKFSKKEEYVICIAAVLYKESTKVVPNESRIFYLLPPDCQYQLDGQRIERLVKKQLGDNYYSHTIWNETLFLETFDNELELLKRFKAYVLECRPYTRTGFNNTSFDDVFLISRMEELGLDGAKKHVRGSFSTRRRSFRISFSDRADEGIIRYKKDKPISESKRKNNAIQKFISNESEEEEGEEEMEDPRMPVNVKGYNALMEGRKIISITFSNMATRDVMRCAGNYYRGIKLDTAAAEKLGIRKLSHAALSYENLFQTWMSGDGTLVAAYCLLDTLITFLLDVHMKTGPSNVAVSDIVKLSPRELYSNETLRTTISMWHCYGWWRNVVSHDVHFQEDREVLYKPDRVYNDKDFSLLKCLGGRTIDGVEGYYRDTLSCLCDFKSQYPSIFISRNVCLTSLLRDLNGLEKNVDYTELVVQNVAPQVVHACQDCSAPSKKCKFEMSFKKVSKTLYFSTSNKFQGLAAQAAKDLLRLRDKYKKLMKTADSPAEVEVYNCLQLATKITANAGYGVMLLLSSEVGGAVTQEGRNQNEIAARFLFQKTGGLAVMADTDSVAFSVRDLPLRKGYALSCLRHILTPGLERPKISLLLDLVVKRFQDYMEELNDGRAWAKPSELCVEKLLISNFFLSKKNYSCLKYENGKLAWHVAGLACKKATKTPLQVAAQMGSLGMLIFNDDISGFAQYVKDIFGIASVCLRKEEMRMMLGRPPEESQLLADQFIVSMEKVNDIENPKSLADRLAVLECERKGIPRENADMFVAVKRRAQVQVGAHLVKIIDSLLSGPASDPEIERQFEKTYFARSEKDQLSVDKRRFLAREKKIASLKEMSPLSVTRVPLDLTADDSYRARLSSYERLLLQEAKYFCEKMEKVVTRERNCGFKNLHFEEPEFFKDKRKLKTKVETVRRIIESYRPKATRLPMWWYDKDFCLTSVKSVDVWERLEHDEVCVDFWEMFLAMKQPRYALVRTAEMGVPLEIMVTNNIPVKFDQYLYPEDNSLFTLLDLNDKGKKIYVMDMEMYALQTSSTPMVVVSPDGQRWLVNRDSYISPTPNVLMFKIDVGTLRCSLAVCKKSLSFKALVETNYVEVILDGKKKRMWEVDGFLRSDGRSMPTWKYHEQNSKSLPKSGLIKVCNMKSKQLKFEFLDDQAFVHFDNNPIPVCLNYGKDSSKGQTSMKDFYFMK